MQPDRPSDPMNPIRNSVLKLVVVTCAALASIAPQARAQTPPKKPDFATIRKTDLATIDRNNVEAWINAQIEQMFTLQDDRALETQGRDFFQAIASSVSASDATPKFREGVAAILADGFLVHLAKAPANRRPLASVYPLMALNQVAQPTPKIIEAFTAALSNSVAGARLLGATGLLAIRGQLNQQQWTALLPVLQKAGSAETSNAALTRMYRLLALPANPPVDTVPAMTAILEARLDRIEKQEGWPLAADAEAVEWLGQRLAGLATPQLQDRATLLIARMLTNAVYTYVNKPVESHLAPLEKVIMTSEAELKKAITRRAPSAKGGDVTKAMLDGGPGQADAMLLELNKWIGTAQQAGALNEAPLNFERGLKITLPSAASKPAPAPK